MLTSWKTSSGLIVLLTMLLGARPVWESDVKKSERSQTRVS